MMQKFIAIFFLFSYIYVIHYIPLPFNFSFVIGAIAFMLYFVRKNFYYRVYENKRIISAYLKPMVPVVVMAVISLLLNAQSDVYFIKWSIINLFYFFGAYFIVQLIYKAYGRFDFHLLVKLLTIVALIQMSITLMKFLSPSLDAFLMSLLNTEGGLGSTLLSEEGHRLIGFGTQFFTSGTTHAFILIMIALELSSKNKQLKEFVFYLASFLIITAIGSMMARTTLIGTGIGLGIICYSNITNFKSLLKLVGAIGVLIVITIVAMKFISPGFYETMEEMVKFGFEMFFNYQQTGTFASKSTQHMFEDMYIFPQNTFTWIFGDGLYDDPTGDGYYMHTDVGYCRLIFYFGIIGAFLYFLANYKICKLAFPQRVYGFIPWASLFVFVLVINAKGTFDLYLFLSLFYFTRNRLIVEPHEKNSNII